MLSFLRNCGSSIVSHLIKAPKFIGQLIARKLVDHRPLSLDDTTVLYQVMSYITGYFVTLYCTSSNLNEPYKLMYWQDKLNCITDHGYKMGRWSTHNHSSLFEIPFPKSDDWSGNKIHSGNPPVPTVCDALTRPLARSRIIFLQADSTASIATNPGLSCRISQVTITDIFPCAPRPRSPGFLPPTRLVIGPLN